MFNKVAIRVAPCLKHLILRPHSVRYQTQRRYTAIAGVLQEAAGYNGRKDLEGNDITEDKPLSIPQRLNQIEKVKFMISNLLGY